MSILPAPMPLCPNTSASALPVQFSHGMSAVSLNSAYKTILFPLIFTIPKVNASLTSLSSAQMICSSSFISQSLFFLYLSISAQDCTLPTPETGNWLQIWDTLYPLSFSILPIYFYKPISSSALQNINILYNISFSFLSFSPYKGKFVFSNFQLHLWSNLSYQL